MSKTKPWGQIRDASVSPERHARNVASAREELARMPLAEVRQALELTQQQLADGLEMDQTGVSRLERRVDPHISTLRRFIKAAGGELRIIAEFPDRDPIEIDFVSVSEQRPKARATARV